MSEQAFSPEAISPEQAIKYGQPVLDYFEITADPATETEEFNRALRQVNPRYSGERNLIRFELEEDQADWSIVVQNATMSAAYDLRMVEPPKPEEVADEPEVAEEQEPIQTHLEGEFKAVAVLGAARQAPLDRARYAAKHISEGRATTDKLVIIGSARQLGDKEREAVLNYVPLNKDEQEGKPRTVIEFDLCEGAARVIREEFPDLEVETMFVDNEKAGTPQIMEHMLSELQSRGELPEGASIAAVTTQIYQTATSIDVARVAAEFGITDTLVAGNPSDPEVAAKRTTATYLSEVIRTMKAASLALQV